MIKFITSLNQDLYIKYGSNFIDSWSTYCSGDVDLTVYCEAGNDWVSESHKASKIKFDNLESKELTKFRSVFGKFIQAQGGEIVRHSSQKDAFKIIYNYRFDALRFSFKAYSLLQELSKPTDHYSHLCWIDADVICRKPFSKDLLMPVLPQGEVVASFLGRSAFPPSNPYSECGFVGYNLQSSQALKFLNRFIDAYNTGLIFVGKEWHDCVLFDNLRREYEALGHEFLNISGEYHDTEHPFVKSYLGVYFDHLKGPTRKAQGHS